MLQGIVENNRTTRDFPGGPVVKKPPSNARDAGLIPGWGTKLPHAVGQLSPRTLEPTATTREKPRASTKTRRSQINK